MILGISSVFAFVLYAEFLTDLSCDISCSRHKTIYVRMSKLRLYSERNRCWTILVRMHRFVLFERKIGKGPLLYNTFFPLLCKLCPSWIETGYVDTWIRVYNLNCVTKILIFKHKCLNINWSYEYIFSFLLIINLNFLSWIKFQI